MSRLVWLAAAWIGYSTAHAQQQQQYDLIIRNGRIIDGTGSPWYSGDLGIRAGRIAAIGRWPAPRPTGRSTRAAWSWPRVSSTCSASRS